MSDPAPIDTQNARTTAKSTHKSFLDRFLSLMRRVPEDRESVTALLEAAHERHLLDTEAYTMIKGALAMSERSVADVMVPHSHIDLLDVNQPLTQVLPTVINTAHSRFPVFENDRDNIIGILLAKDLLRCLLDPAVEMRTLLRPAFLIPESKRLNVLLHEFRANRNHLAVVIDEHGGIAGLVTMEDVLEQIVGDIEDEYDEDKEDTIFREDNEQWRVMATTKIVLFNETFSTGLSDDDYDTIGGWLSHQLERIPRRGDSVHRENLHIEVIRADARRALWLRVTRQP